MKIIPWIALVLATAGCAEAQTVGVKEFEDGLQNSNVQLLDVRTDEEFQEGHIPNAMLADVNDKEEFRRRTSALDKEQAVYVYCLGGARSADAAGTLRKQGFSKVVELDGGINAWRGDGKAVEGTGYTPVISTEAYSGMVNSSPLMLVAFSAKWCPPCRKMAPVMAKLQVDYAGNNRNTSIHFVTIDGGAQVGLMKANNVAQMPTYILYKEGKEVWRASGILDKAEFRLNFDKFGTD